MINRGDIKLAIDMVVNAQDDNLFGGEAEYVINTLEDCGNEITKLREQVAAQAAVIEKLRVAYVALENFAQTVGGSSSFWEDMNDVLEPASCIANFNTDRTHILDGVRQAERERVAQFVDDNCTYGDTHILVKAIRAME